MSLFSLLIGFSGQCYEDNDYIDKERDGLH